EDGSKGYVHHILDDHLIVLHLGTRPVVVGTTVVAQHDQLVAKVGRDFIGRVISVTGEPLDAKGPIAADAVWPVFASAPPFHSREALDRQLETGITVIDTLFPLMRGQRMAVLGDGKVGKSTLATQIALNQINTDIITVYCLIAKRRSDVDMLLTRLLSYSAMEKTIVIVSTMADSLVLNYLAPYVACSVAEYLWQKCDQDTLLIYDDLTAHAHAYREIALLSGSSPGRDSFPGDMFYTHSSLLERAGKLASNHKTLTTLPMVFAPGGDITSYLPTNVMSITDGQWILDMKVFRDTMRPAVNVGLSVSRVGGRGQSDRHKKLGSQMLKTLTAHTQAAEFARFGSELAPEAQVSLKQGAMLYKLLNQGPGDVFNLMGQQLMLEIALNLEANQSINIELLKKSANAEAARVAEDKDFEKVRDDLRKKVLMVEAKKPEEKKEKPESEEKPAETAGQPAPKEATKEEVKK
ncbi:MAG TPA: sodium-transporting two-sector ATPase, partial [Candidatus Saccharimonadales bacterium]|nr:sodium-transporting two-sector ATPase [Candidatus Saccharimonadales bacterium]